MRLFLKTYFVTPVNKSISIDKSGTRKKLKKKLVAVFVLYCYGYFIILTLF